MARQANGQYLQPANTAAVSGQTISSTAFNTLVTDIGTEITNSLDRGGRSAMTASLPMGGQKITGMADPSVATDAATKNYVDNTTAAFAGTGDVKLTFKSSPDTGWLMLDDGTFGGAGSGSSNSNSAANQALFTLFFGAFSDAIAPIFTSGGGGTTRAAQINAASAWAANCRMSLPKMLGRAVGIAGSGSGLTFRALGSTVGNETVTLSTANLPAYTPSGTVTSTSTPANVATGTPLTVQSGAGSTFQAFANTTMATGTLTSTGGLTGNAQGGTSTAFSIMQPTAFLNAMVKV